jgi:ABC-type branched-subunit amino acid transport system substrate-binding protein
MYYTSVAAPVSQFPAAAQYATDYQAAFNDTAPPFSAQAYDSTGFCIAGILEAAIAAGGVPERAAVVESIFGLPLLSALTGSFEFNDKGDPETATYFVLQANVADWNANELVERLEIAPPQ